MKKKYFTIERVEKLKKTPKNTSFTSPDPRSHYKNDTVEKGTSSFIFPKLFRLKN